MQTSITKRVYYTLIAAAVLISAGVALYKFLPRPSEQTLPPTGQTEITAQVNGTIKYKDGMTIQLENIDNNPNAFDRQAYAVVTQPGQPAMRIQGRVGTKFSYPGQKMYSIEITTIDSDRVRFRISD